MTPGVAPEDRPVAAVVAGWRRADERLYPLVLVDPQRYMTLVSVIRDVADRLVGCETAEDLVRARDRGHELVASSCASAGVPVERLGDVDAVADAAFGLKHREMTAMLRRRRIVGTITAARERRHAWVTIDDAGHPGQPGVVGYERIDMRLADGAAIRSAVEIDPDTFHPVYSIERLRLDPDTGDVIERSTSADTFADRAPWERAVARWRDDVAGHRGGP